MCYNTFVTLSTHLYLQLSSSMKLDSLVDLCAKVLCIHRGYVDMCRIPGELAQELWNKRCSLVQRGIGYGFTYHIKEPVEWDPFVILEKRILLLIENYNNNFFSEKKRNEAGFEMMEYLSTHQRYEETGPYSCYIKQRILSFLAYVDDNEADEFWWKLFKRDIPAPVEIVQIVLRGKRIDELSIFELKEAIKTLLQMLHRQPELIEIKVDTILDKDVLGDMVRTCVKEFHFTVRNNPLGLHRTKGKRCIPHPLRTNQSIVVDGHAYKQCIEDGWLYDEDTRIWTHSVYHM